MWGETGDRVDVFGGRELGVKKWGGWSWGHILAVRTKGVQQRGIGWD